MTKNYSIVAADWAGLTLHIDGAHTSLTWAELADAMDQSDPEARCAYRAMRDRAASYWEGAVRRGEMVIDDDHRGTYTVRLTTPVPAGDALAYRMRLPHWPKGSRLTHHSLRSAYSAAGGMESDFRAQGWTVTRQPIPREAFA